MDTVAHLLYQITYHCIVVLIIAVLLCLLLLTTKKLRILGLFILALGILNLRYGYRITNRMIYTYGENGTAIITGIQQTDTKYNYQPVMEYRVSVEIAASQKVHATFKSNDLNIHPAAKTGYVYPRQGIPFAIKYLKNHPDIFVIISQ